MCNAVPGPPRLATSRDAGCSPEPRATKARCLSRPGKEGAALARSLLMHPPWAAMTSVDASFPISALQLPEDAIARWARRLLRQGRGLLPPPSPPLLGQGRYVSEDRLTMGAGAPRAAVHSIGSRRMLVAATIIDEALADSRRRPGLGASCSGRLRARRQSRRALWHGGMCLPIVGTTQPLMCYDTRARCSLSKSIRHLSPNASRHGVPFVSAA